MRLLRWLQRGPLPESGTWETATIAKHRPSGDWVNWNYGSGWVRVRGLRHHHRAVRRFLRNAWLIQGTKATMSVDLVRRPDNGFDVNAVEVWVFVTHQPNKREKLGHIPKDVAAWLARTYASEMPIAAELAKVRTDWTKASITICGLMPPKKQRDRYLR